jgi:pimeloyl-ACP methyl ester carboxylesterase
MEQEIRFCTTSDGVRIAYAILGSGPPLVYVCGWPQHLDLEMDSSFSQAFIEDLAEGVTLVRYDMRGGGLSDRNVEGITAEASALDLAAVVDHLRFEQVALVSFGLLAGPIAMTYAAEHPERVSRMVLCAPYLNGEKIISPERRHALVEYARNFGFPFASFTPEPFMDRDQITQTRRTQQASADNQTQAQLLEALFSANVEELVPRVSMPVLVMHAREDPYVPFTLGREAALRLPNAEFVPFESSTPALWQQRNVILPELRRFLGIASQALQQEASGA